MRRVGLFHHVIHQPIFNSRNHLERQRTNSTLNLNVQVSFIRTSSIIEFSLHQQNRKSLQSTLAEHLHISTLQRTRRRPFTILHYWCVYILSLGCYVGSLPCPSGHDISTWTNGILLFWFSSPLQLPTLRTTIPPHDNYHHQQLVPAIHISSRLHQLCESLSNTILQSGRKGLCLKRPLLPDWRHKRQ